MERLNSNDLFVSQHNSGYNVTQHMYLGDKLYTREWMRHGRWVSYRPKVESTW